MRRFSTLLWPAGLALGVAAERTSYGWSDVRHWLPDLAVGWTFIACGLLASSRRPESRSGMLLALTGFTWFAGNFSDDVLFLYRGPLVHLALTYPGLRRRSRLDLAAVATAYVVSVITPIWESPIGTAVLAALVVAVPVRGYLAAVGRDRRERLAAVEAAAGLGTALAIAAVHQSTAAGSTFAETTLLLFQIALCVLALGLLAGLLTAPWAHGRVGDLVVELGESRSGSLRDALAAALGDPALRVGYRLSDAGTYVHADGRPFALPEAGPEVAVTYIDRDGERIAVLVHDPAVLEDPELVAAVGAASRLAAANARLQADVRTQVAELEAARMRLVASGDEERRRLEQRLREGAEQRLLAIGAILAEARKARSVVNGATGANVDRANVQLERTLGELGELASGLHPRVLADEGIGGALRLLASRSSVPVDLSTPDEGVPGRVEAAVYFVCSEALANVAKYAAASRASVTVAVRDGRVRVDIRDDGIGGADPARGTGLAGLADRVEAMGGELRVVSPAAAGTSVVAEIPIV
jgi:signal transduction histidine kinase